MSWAKSHHHHQPPTHVVRRKKLDLLLVLQRSSLLVLVLYRIGPNVRQCFLLEVGFEEVGGRLTFEGARQSCVHGIRE